MLNGVADRAKDGGLNDVAGNANDKQIASLRMGAQVPLPTMIVPNPDPGKPNPFGGGPVQYKAA